MSFITFVYCKVKDKLSVCIKTKTPSRIPEKESKLCICVWTPMTWPRISESNFRSKIPSHNSWKRTELSKLFCNNNVPLVAQRFEHNVLPQDFPGAVSSCNLLKTPYRVFDFFLRFLNHRVFDNFIQFKNYFTSASHCFCYFNAITDNQLNSVTKYLK